MLEKETLLTFSQAAKRLPQFDGGRRPCPATVWRWARHGVRGIILESRLFGGRYVTSIEALDRFSKALAETAPAPRVPSRDTSHSKPQGRTAAQRERDIERAERRLDVAGIK